MPVPPQQAVTHIDSCAFDPKNNPAEENAMNEIRNYQRVGLVPDFDISYSTKNEINNSRTPLEVQRVAQNSAYTISTSRTDEQRDLFSRIRGVVVGNGKMKNYNADAEHIFEACQYASYFITLDKAILAKRERLHQICSFSLFIVRPTEFLALIKRHASRF